MSTRRSNIFVTVDAVIFRHIRKNTEVLLINRKNEPFVDKWALPGGFVDQDEDLEKAAIRELFEETGIKINSLSQLRAFGKPHRDPRGHMISVAFTGTTNDSDVAKAGDDAADAQWFPINALPELAFDHDEIINFAIQSKLQ